MAVDESFVMHVIIAVTLQQTFHLEDKDGSSALKESRTPVKHFCTLFVYQAFKRNVNLVNSDLESSCEFWLHIIVATNV